MSPLELGLPGWSGSWGRGSLANGRAISGDIGLKSRAEREVLVAEIVAWGTIVLCTAVKVILALAGECALGPTAMLRTIDTPLLIFGMGGSHPAAHQMLFNGVQALAVPAAARSSELRAPLESGEYAQGCLSF